MEPGVSIPFVGKANAAQELPQALAHAGPPLGCPARPVGPGEPRLPDGAFRSAVNKRSSFPVPRLFSSQLPSGLEDLWRQQALAHSCNPSCTLHVQRILERRASR